MNSSFWFFSAWRTATDSDWGEDDSSGIQAQPDHQLNVARPHKKRKKRRKKHITDAVCPTCRNNKLVNGSCPQCSWGDNPSDAIENFPLDPVKDDRAGIRASSVESRLIDKDDQTNDPKDWWYEWDPYGRGFWVNFPATNSGALIGKEELDAMLKKEKEESGQMSLNLEASQKKSDYNGWSNWDTYSVVSMIESDQEDMSDVRNLIKAQAPLSSLQSWAIQMIIGPYNQNAFAMAQEWNELPTEDRPTGKEEMSEDTRELADKFDQLFGFNPQEDVSAETIDESLVNWQEIYDHYLEIVQENETEDHNAGSHVDGPENHPICPLCSPPQEEQLTVPKNWSGF